MQRVAAARVARLVSGGQTGVDRAALDVALECGLPCGGWCPAGRPAEDGPIPTRYPLRETPSADPAQRTGWNVRDSDATLILLLGPPAGGTRTTIDAARALHRPLLIVDLDRPRPPREVARWLDRPGGATLNVAGPREGECPGIYGRARTYLLGLLARAP